MMEMDMKSIRPRHRWPTLTIVYCALASLPASAQALPEDECARLENPEAEIICLRAALAATRQAQQSANTNFDAAKTGDAPARAPSAAPDRQAELGSEQLAGAAFVQRSPDDRESVASTIVDFRLDRNGRLIMQLANGQIWRQVESLAVPIRLDADGNVGVEITRSGFGGYRMTFPEMNRRISVSRER